ncbi:hypothetical protein WSM22_19970 [Cytophagales bacterium WSM2-2]|nr:hypothetical protein WSM22_19970 [Cytophagales bacterium WSM2-2]
MKKLILSGFLILVGVMGFAQRQAASRTPEQRAEAITTWMTKKLKLTDDQKTRIYDVNLKYAKLNQEARTEDANNTKTLHEELRANEKEREADFKTILTPEQQQAFQTAKQELAERRKGRRGRI